MKRSVGVKYHKSYSAAYGSVKMLESILNERISEPSQGSFFDDMSSRNFAKAFSVFRLKFL